METKPVLDYLTQNGGSLLLTTLAVTVLVMIVARVWKRAASGLEETIFSNWRLGLLGATGIVLSLASGWTTWDGMRNFTQEPLLSGMITFGIQGVMLIVAWLIGESFATGMQRGNPGGAARAWLGGLIGAAVACVLVLLALDVMGVVDVKSAAVFSNFDWRQFGDTYLIVGAAFLLILLIALSGTDLLRPYFQSARIIVRNAMLWVMFLACMATSVFFSFDSLFSTIFPKDERARAAELRAQNQVAGLIAEIDQTIVTKHIAESQALFATDGWLVYETQLAGVALAARESEGAIEKYFNEQIEAKNRAVREQQERMVSAQTGQAGLESRKTTLAEELSRLKAERPTLAAEAAEKKSVVDALIKDADAKRVEALAEDKGVEGTGKEGRGPQYRERMAELAKLQAAQKIAEERLKDAQRRLTTVDTRLAQVERELAAVDGELANLKGEVQTAGDRIKLTEAAVSVDATQQIDPARLVPIFEQVKAEFRKDPTDASLAKVQQVCSQIYGAMSSTEATKVKIKAFDCDPKLASEAAAVIFSLNTGRETFAKNCAGGDKLSQQNSTDALFGFARRCLSDSGLPAAETDALRVKINRMELSRDDKAHRFVVTWNAFEDGNRLAYLALAIAIAIDSLIFMSGLFGANAVRSPLSDMPGGKARSAQQLEAVINAALGVRPYETASLVLSALRPAPANTHGFSALATLDGLDPEQANRIRQVLTAGADIGAVQPVGTLPECYRVRSELREYLSTVCDKELKADPSHARREKLKGIVRAALKPHTREHAEIVAASFQPTKTDSGFTSRVFLDKVADEDHRRVIRRVINAGAMLQAVTPDERETECYYIRPELYETLLEISANDPPSPTFGQDPDRARQQALPNAHVPHAAISGGSLTAVQERLSPAPATKQLTQIKPADPAAKTRANRFDWPVVPPTPLQASRAAKPVAGDKAADTAGIDQSPPDNEPSPQMLRVFATKLEVTQAQVKALLDLRDLRLAHYFATVLGTIADNDRLFRDRLEWLQTRKRSAIGEASAALISSGVNPKTASLLSEYMTRILPLILLVEMGGYERQLSALVDEAQEFSEEEFAPWTKTLWLRVMQDHHDEFVRLPRRDPEHWPPVQQCLRKFVMRLAEMNDMAAGRRGNLLQ